jgi:MFS family permease
MPKSERLFSRGFLALLVTQLFGAVNDSVLKQVLILAVASGGIWQSKFGEGGQGYVALCLTIPFILFSGIAGQIADRTSKRKIAILAKMIEVVIAVIALAAFLGGNFWACLGALILLAIQSAFFGPAKYGMIPELVSDRNLSQANGSINMFTNLAVIGGSLLAGSVYKYYATGFSGDKLIGTMESSALWLPGILFVVIALIGLIPSFFIPKLKSFHADLQIDFNPIRPYVKALKEMSRSSLLVVALAWSFFYLIGMIALLLIPDFAGENLLNIPEDKNNLIIGILGISIGLGSVVAGLISGKHIEPRLIPIGAIGMTIFFFLIGLAPVEFMTIAALIGGAGFFAGFYIVPLQALLQHLSPQGERGRFLGTANALSFVFSSIGALLVPFMRGRNFMHLPANHAFLVCGVISTIGTGILLWHMRRLLADPKLRRAAPIS